MNTRKLTLTFLIIAREAFDSLSNGAPHSDGHRPAAFDFGGKDTTSTRDLTNFSAKIFKKFFYYWPAI